MGRETNGIGDYDNDVLGLGNSQHPDNREQQPRELTQVEQLQIEVDELNSKLREEIEKRIFWYNKHTEELTKVTKAEVLIKQMESIESRSGFRITGATLNDGKRYLELKGELFNLIN